jgi:hypothetical protein
MHQGHVPKTILQPRRKDVAMVCRMRRRYRLSPEQARRPACRPLLRAADGQEREKNRRTYERPSNCLHRRLLNTRRSSEMPGPGAGSGEM